MIVSPHPDDEVLGAGGRVADYGSKLRSAVSSLLDADTTVLVPYEQDGHPDHDAATRDGLLHPAV